MFEQQRLCSEGMGATRTQELGNGDKQLNSQFPVLMVRGIWFLPWTLA